MSDSYYNESNDNKINKHRSKKHKHYYTDEITMYLIDKDEYYDYKYNSIINEKAANNIINSINSFISNMRKYNVNLSVFNRYNELISSDDDFNLMCYKLITEDKPNIYFHCYDVFDKFINDNKNNEHIDEIKEIIETTKQIINNNLDTIEDYFAGYDPTLYNRYSEPEYYNEEEEEEEINEIVKTYSLNNSY